MQSRLGNSCRHDLQGVFLLRFCNFMIIMSQHFFLSFLPDINWVGKKQDKTVQWLHYYILSSTISRKVHLLVFSDLGVAVEFCWAGLFYSSSLQFPTSKSQSFGVCSLGGAVVAVYALRVSWSFVVSAASLMTPSKCCCHLTNFFDEARHCGTIVNLQCALGKMHMSLTQDLMSVVP